jgi:hypothetical protein
MRAPEPALVAKGSTGDLPDLLVIGDSHSNALVEGCVAHGLRVEMLRFSGNLWHAGRIVLHEEHGLWVTGSRGLQRQVLELRGRLGGRSVLSPDVPVMATLGFHLGRLVPPFGLHGHTTDVSHFESNPEALYASHALLDAYLGAHRGALIRLARQMSRQTRAVFVAPPHFAERPNYRSFLTGLVRRMRALRLNVHNPNETLAPTGSVVRSDYLTGDGNHGNGAYGTAVIAEMLEKGLIARRADPAP